MKLTRLILDRDRLGILFFSLIVLLGTMVYQDFPSREEPAIRIPRATVITWFPGMVPEQVEQLISRRIEEKIREIGEVKHVLSYSRLGLSIVEVRLHEHVPDFGPVWQRVRHKVDEVRSLLPSGVQGPYVNDEYADVSIVTLALTGPDWTLAELEHEARRIRDELYGIDGIRRVRQFGVAERRVYLEMDPSTVEAGAFNIGTAIEGIRDRNTLWPAGELRSERRSVSVVTGGELAQADDLGELTVATEGGDVLPLTDYVDVTAGYVDPPLEAVYYNSKRAIMISGSLQPNSNVQAMGPVLRGFVQEARRSLPVGMVLEIAHLQPDAVDQAVGVVTTSLYQTLVIVLCVVVLALGVREGLILGVTVPVTMLASLIIIYWMGVELQFVSLASLVISLGMLVDNGIVITEEIHRRVRAGSSATAAAIASAEALWKPLLTSTLTTVLAFMPILLLNTTSGEFNRSLAQVVGVTLMCSWLVSLTFIPLICARLISRGHGEVASGFDKHGSWLVRLAVGRPLPVLGAIVLVVCGFFSLFRYVPVEMFPVSSRPEVLVYVDLPAGYNVHQTGAAVADISRWLHDPKANPHVEAVSSYIGTGGPRFSLSIVPNQPAANRAFMIVRASDSHAARELIGSIREHAAARVSQAHVRTELISRGVVPPGVVELRFSGSEAGQLLGIGKQAEHILAGIPDTLHVRTDWENKARSLRINIDPGRLHRAGASYQSVADALRSQFSGEQVTRLRTGDLLVPVVVRSSGARGEEGTRVDLGSIKIPVGTGSRGEYTTLDQVADIVEDTQFGVIVRRDMRKAITVSGKHLYWDSATLQAEWDMRLKDLIESLPPGYRVDLGGELESYSNSADHMAIAVPLFLGLILCIVTAQFNSVRRTFIVFVSIPLAMSGGVIGLLVADAKLDFIGMLGFLSLAGIVVNHAIVLIDKADALISTGETVLDAMTSAAVSRFRPIVITSTTTILGLIPLLMMEDKLFHAMTIVIMSGLTIGTLFTVLAVPAMYVVLLSPERPYRLVKA